MCARVCGLRAERAKCWGLSRLSVTEGSSAASMNFSWEWDGPYLSFGGSWEGRREHRGHMAAKQDGCESCQQSSCAGSWQVLVSSVSQKRPAKKKYKPFLNRGACFLMTSKNWKYTMRSRNKKSTEGGSESSKNQTSLSTRDYVFLFTLWCYSRHRYSFCSVMLFAAISYASDTVTLPNNLCLAEELDVNVMRKAWSMRCRIYWSQVLPE